MSDPRRRSDFYTPQIALKNGGNLTDNTQGWHRYREYLSWVSESEPAQRQLGFKRMSKGWAIGSNATRAMGSAPNGAKLSHEGKWKSASLHVTRRGYTHLAARFGKELIILGTAFAGAGLGATRAKRDQV